LINAVFWMLRAGAPWRDLPPSDGDWKNTHGRFCRWRDRAVWEDLLEPLAGLWWLMIDASHIRVYSHAAGAVDGHQTMSHTKGASTARYTWPWMPMVCRSERLSDYYRDTIADCTKAKELVEGMDADYW
jgi:hypothetical protein